MNDVFMQKLNATGVDTPEAINRFNGNDALYLKFLIKFLQDDNFNQLGPALQKQDYQAALNAAHTLKGVAGNLGMKNLYLACSDMVQEIRNEQTENCQTTYETIKNAYEEVTKTISEIEEAL